MINFLRIIIQNNKKAIRKTYNSRTASSFENINFCIIILYHIAQIGYL